MKSAISLLLVVICTVVLAARQSQAKKGCQAYGHVCYGGHGKRSLSAGVGAGASAGETGGVVAEQEYVRPNGLLPMLAPNEQTAVIPESAFDEYPSRQVLYRILKSWFNYPRRPGAMMDDGRIGELDYAQKGGSVENFQHENALNAFN